MHAPSSKDARTPRDTDERQEEISLQENGPPSWDDAAPLLDVTQEDRAQAISYPHLGWPDFARLLGDAGEVHLTHTCFDAAPFRNLSSRTSFNQEERVGPVSSALAEVELRR